MKSRRKDGTVSFQIPKTGKVIFSFFHPSSSGPYKGSTVLTYTQKACQKAVSVYEIFPVCHHHLTRVYYNAYLIKGPFNTLVFLSFLIVLLIVTDLNLIYLI